MSTAKKLLSLLLSIVLCGNLLAFSVSAKIILPESAHPYENNFEETWELTYPGNVAGFFLTFSADTYLEPAALICLNEDEEEVILHSDELMEMYNVIDEAPESEEAARIRTYLESLTYDRMKQGDWLELRCSDQIIDIVSGGYYAGKTLYVPGKTVTLTLHTDESETAYGFRVIRAGETAPENVLTVSYYYDDTSPVWVDCLSEGETIFTPDNVGVLREEGACIGWTDTPGGAFLYGSYEELQVKENLSLYAVYTQLLLQPEEVFSFDNDYDPFAVNGITFSYRDFEQFTLTNYYMERQDLMTLIRSFAKTLGITPLGLSAIREAILFPVSMWGGSCYGMSLSVAMQHFGKLDMLSMQEGAENVSDLEGTPALVSLINYYQLQEIPATLTQTTANIPGSPWYKMQLQKMYETVADGDLVLFGLFDLHSYDSLGHAVLLTGAYDDPDGNHILIAYDSNYGSDYAKGMAWTRFYISPDFSEITSDEYDVYGFDWLSDFSGFDAFHIDGGGDPMHWYRSVLDHMRMMIEMLKKLFESYAAVFAFAG